VLCKGKTDVIVRVGT